MGGLLVTFNAKSRSRGGWAHCPVPFSQYRIQPTAI